MKNVEDVYALSPMQEFMLLHSAHHGGDDVLFNQFCYEIEGELDAAAFRAAWQTLLDRHSILRTAFVWEKVKTPVQVVRRALELPFRSLDWSDHDAAGQARLLDALRADDRNQPFDLTRAPLMRLVLVRLAERRHWLLWSNHHLLMDRWCLGPLFDEMHALYEAALHGAPATIATPRPFRDYIAWIAKQDVDAARRHWRETLAGFRRATPLCRDHVSPTTATASPGAPVMVFDGPEFHDLRSRARAAGLTTGSMVYAAWALAMHAIIGSDDLVFGAAVSGRPPDLPGVESIVGSFINNLPVRARLYADITPLDVARAVQTQQQRQMRRDFLSPAAIAACSDCDGSQPLFDNLLVWLAPAAADTHRELQLRLLPGRLDTAYPLAVAIAENDRSLQFHAHLAAGRRTLRPLHEVLAGLAGMLRLLSGESATRRLGEFSWFDGDKRAPAAPVAVLPPLPARADQAPVAGGREAESEEMVAGMLNAQWQEVLGHDDLDPRCSFFDAGGTSLLAATLHARVQASLRRAIPLLPLFGDPTIAGMTRTLLDSDWPRLPAYVTTLRRSGTRPPLFGIASPEVNTLGFGLLARHLGAEQPVHVVQAPPDSERIRRLSPREVPALCGRYVEEMRRVQPRGPYRFIAMCTGAQMALEMTRLLEADGECVTFVGLLDTWAHYTVSRLYHVHRIANRARYYRDRVGNLLRRPAAEQMAELRRIASRRRAAATPTPADADAVRSAAAPDHAPSPVDVSAEDERAALEWLYEFGLPENDPRLPPVAAPVSVFRLQPQPFWRVQDRTLGWGRQAREVHVEFLAGDDHDAILREPGVRELARRLCERLAVVDAHERSSAA